MPSTSNPRSIELKVGLLILAAALLLAGFILVMGGINFQPTYPIYVDFDNPGGVQPGAPVRIAGVRVGKVQDVAFRGGARRAGGQEREPLVRLRLSVERRYASAIHENALVYVTNQSVLGEPFLAIEPGSSERNVLGEGATLRGLDPPRLDMLLAEMYELLHTTASTIRENKAEIREAFDGLRHTLKGTGDFFGKNGDKLDRIAENADRLTAEADELISGAKAKFVDNPEVGQMLGNMSRVSGDLARELPPLLADAKGTMANGKRLTDSLADPKEIAKIREMISDLGELARRGKSAAGGADDLITHVKQGKGSVGAVLMSDQLIKDVEDLIHELKRRPWRLIWRD